MCDETKEPWHLDKRIPIVLILSILLQAGSFVWWASKIDGKAEDHERRLIVVEKFDMDIGQRLAKIEISSEYMSKSMDKISINLEKQTDILVHSKYYRNPKE